MPGPRSTPALKDSYGFLVKRDHHELFKQYAPIWAKEEVERASLWSSFLLSFAPEGTRKEDAEPAAQLDAACAAGLEPFKAALSGWREQRDGQDGAAPPEVPDWLPQLRSLVQAGVPKALRGRLWQIFLELDRRREPGLYEQLVQKALGNTKYGRKRNTASGEVDTSFLAPASSADAPAASGRPAGPQSHPAEPSSSDTESHGMAYAPAAADVTPDHASEGAAAPDAAPAAAQRPARSRRTMSSSSRLSASGSESGGRRSRASTEPWHPSTNDWNVQIEKDLHRTFPGHPIMNRKGRGTLRRILAAYSRRNDAVGYCQGMNFIAGVMLLFMEEEDAFWALTAVVEDLLPGYFALDLIMPQVDQLVFKHLVDQRFPTLCGHLTKHGVNVSSMALNWFLTMFVTSLPLECTLRVWDVLFFDRCASVLFRCGLALVDIYAQALVATVDSIDAFTLLHAMAPMSFDASRLIDMACIAFSALTMGQIQSLRKAYRTSIVASKLHDSSEDDDAAWANSDEEELSTDDEAAPDSPTGPMGSGDYYSGSDSDESEEDAITPTRLSQLDAPVPKTDGLDDVRRFVSQIPSNELLAGNTASRTEPATPAGQAAHPNGTATGLSPVDEASSSAEKASPGSAQALHAAEAPAQPQQQQQPAPVARKRSDGGLGAATAAASAVSKRLGHIATERGNGQPASRRLFGRKRSRKVPAAPGAAVLSGAVGEDIASVARNSSAAAEAAYHIAATPFKTPPRAKLVPGSTPICPDDMAPGLESQDAIAPAPASVEGGAAAPPSPAAAEGAGRDVQETMAAPSSRASSRGGSAAERARRHIENASSVVARTIGDAFGGRVKAAEEAAPEPGRHAAAMAQLLSVVEGLEEELFQAEAACHEAEVEASSASSHAADARKELDAAVAELQEKAALVDALHDKLLGVNNTLAFFDSELQAKERALLGVRAQVAEREQQIAHKDALIAQLLQQAGKAPPNGSSGAAGGGFFSKLRTSVARSPNANGELGEGDSPAPSPASRGTLSMWGLKSRAGSAAGSVSGSAPGSPVKTATVGSPATGSAAGRSSGDLLEAQPAAAARAASAADGEAGLQIKDLDAERAAQNSGHGDAPAAAAAGMQPKDPDAELQPRNLDELPPHDQGAQTAPRDLDAQPADA